MQLSTPPDRWDEATSGTVYFEGRDYRDLLPRELRRRIGMVTQTPYLFPGTIGENLRFGPSHYGCNLPKGSVDQLLDEVGLRGLAGSSVDHLSGGEAQRVALTRALANLPSCKTMELLTNGGRIVTSRRRGSLTGIMKELTRRSDSDLLRQLRVGNEDAFSAIYRRHHDAVYRFALHMTGNTGIAEEVTQEVFLTLIREWQKFDPERGTLGAFLVGIGRNHVLRFLEKERSFVASEVEDLPDERYTEGSAENPVDPLEALTQRETVTRVRAAVLSLPGAYREVVVLCDLEGKSYSEAAGVLACAVGTVRSRLHRARGLLLQKLRVFHVSALAAGR